MYSLPGYKNAACCRYGEASVFYELNSLRLRLLQSRRHYGQLTGLECALCSMSIAPDNSNIHESKTGAIKISELDRGLQSSVIEPTPFSVKKWSIRLGTDPSA